MYKFLAFIGAGLILLALMFFGLSQGVKYKMVCTETKQQTVNHYRHSGRNLIRDGYVTEDVCVKYEKVSRHASKS